MLKNYILVALRNLWRHRGYSLINIFGLTIGLASTIFILLYVINELTYDQFHEKSDRIYRVWISGSGEHAGHRDAACGYISSYGRSSAKRLPGSGAVGPAQKSGWMDREAGG